MNSKAFFRNLILKNFAGDSSAYCKVDLSFSLSGTIFGLTTSGMVLKTITGTEVSIPAGSTRFSIPISLGVGARYTLSISSQPETIVCLVHTGWEGVVPNGISDIKIVCHSTVAKRVYGQSGSFISNGFGLSADFLYTPYQALADGNGLFVSDFGNNRVLYYPGTGTTASFVYGQLDFSSALVGTSTTEINRPRGLIKDKQGLYITDANNNRALYFEGTNSFSTRVYGQLDFVSAAPNQGGATASNTLATPYGMTRDANGLYIVDQGNNRVLYYNDGSILPTRVYGQNDFLSNNTGSTATSLVSPEGVSVSSEGVYIADTGNNRVLFYLGTSTIATRVYGQPDFVSNVANNGTIGSGTLNSPKAVLAFGGDLWIVDSFNNRVLLFSGTSTTASKVFGQNGSFVSSTSNATATTFFQPQGISVDQDGIYIVDTDNNRVLVF
ncbi:NHL repeat-containing protein [Leptospira wolbachii]|uniref:NHL repeat-containing protein n=1 Tax=Leptospira wolbachii TaxID=29511 RepID=UPI001E37AAC1|nr:NHL repeat-containing protein [Leptospira wolbachii]